MKKRNEVQCIALIIGALALMHTTCVSAQVSYPDSLRIENERSMLLGQFAVLRDSINATISAIDQSSKKSLPKTAQKLTTLLKEISQNKEQLDKLTDELSTTSQKAWNQTSVNRIQLTGNTIRANYRAEKKKYDRTVKRKKRTIKT